MEDNTDFINDSLSFDSWDNILEMAENYTELQEELEGENLYGAYPQDYFEQPTQMSNQACDHSLWDKHFETPEEALQSLFGYGQFRDGQKEVIEALLSGRDGMIVMPTGAGKSLCYQIPAVMLPGITLVISPLISLMQDQVASLNEVGIPAAFINSSLSETAYFDTLHRTQMGCYKLLYVAPERLTTESFLELTKTLQISMVTVDEAHCISQWGQDFRPSYLKIVEFIQTLKNRPIISAFTATATELVRTDILRILRLRDPFVQVTGFDRENLFFQVERPKNKDQYVLNYLEKHKDESGIIYCATRKNVDKLYELLLERGLSVVKYHGGMGTAERKRMQEEFVYDYKQFVVATNAFGMGIDKSNVRFVLHYNMPQCMENYYQEAGRAGRDGLAANCILLFSPQDIVIDRFLIEHKEAQDLSMSEKRALYEQDLKRLQSMERYCYTTECLRNAILTYFGEKPIKPCENCGNCVHEFETLDMTAEAKKIINCVFEAKGRFGRSIIIDAVTGAKTARLEEIGAIAYQSYAVLEGANKTLLRRLIEQMIMERYLLVGEYQVLKLGDITALKNPEQKVLVKITEEDKVVKQVSKVVSQAMSADKNIVLSPEANGLFEVLRMLRMELARAEQVPPYIIFNDKTLVDMTVKMPENKQEMLAVSGVGENKYSKYGERFLEVIAEQMKTTPGLVKWKEECVRDTSKVESASETKQSIAEKQQKKSNKKMEFHLLPEEAAQFQYAETLRVSDITAELNRICERTEVKKLPAGRLTKILLEDGLIEEREENGYLTKMPTKKGETAGVIPVHKISDKGNPYVVLVYSEQVQKMLLGHFIEK